jgi:hypothetical protein
MKTHAEKHEDTKIDGNTEGRTYIWKHAGKKRGVRGAQMSIEFDTNRRMGNR